MVCGLGTVDCMEYEEYIFKNSVFSKMNIIYRDFVCLGVCFVLVFGAILFGWFLVLVFLYFEGVFWRCVRQGFNQGFNTTVKVINIVYIRQQLQVLVEKTSPGQRIVTIWYQMVHALIIFVPLHWTCFRISVSHLSWEPQEWTQHLHVSQWGWAKGKDHLPWTAGNIPTHIATAAVGLLCCENELLAGSPPPGRSCPFS